MIALKSMIGSTAQTFHTYLSHRGEETGNIRGSMRVRVPSERMGTRERLYGNLYCPHGHVLFCARVKCCVLYFMRCSRCIRFIPGPVYQILREWLMIHKCHGEERVSCANKIRAVLTPAPHGENMQVLKILFSLFTL